MPWKETCVVNTRLEFVTRALAKELSFDELCREYGISPKTGYKWKQRFLERGAAGLEDQSRRPKTSPRQLEEGVLCEIIRIKKDHPGWGPYKIREVYARIHGDAELPSESTFKRVLEKAGFVKKRKRRRNGDCGRIENRLDPEEPNALWTVDFKGWWYTGNRERCEPLTVRDAFSRFVLCARPLANARSVTVRKEFERLFTAYGLPRIIRSDNGTPFACSSAPLGLSKLSAWWVALGISLDRIAPARPDQNGAHERMHRDIAQEVERCPEVSLRRQRAALETWRNTYNQERPHEALGMRVPAELYRKSTRRWTPDPIELVYPDGFMKRRVSGSGMLSIEGVKICVSTAIGGWHVGLRSCPDGEFLVWFGPLCLGTIDLRSRAFRRAEQVDGQPGGLDPKMDLSL